MPAKAHKASDYLKAPEDAAAYLNAALEEMGDDPRLLMKAFRNVAEAQGGVSAVARPSPSAVISAIWPSPVGPHALKWFDPCVSVPHDRLDPSTSACYCVRHEQDGHPEA